MYISGKYVSMYCALLHSRHIPCTLYSVICSDKYFNLHNMAVLVYNFYVKVNEHSSHANI